MSAPLFSVLLPTNGRADVIGASIRSILAQTEGDFELLVVGDGCRDETEAVVLGFDDPRVTWLPFEKGPGYGYVHRNTALDRARGRIVAFAQHDDLMFPDHLALLAARLRGEGALWAYSRPLWIDDEGTVFPYFVNLVLPGARDRMLHRQNVIPTGCVAILATALDTVGRFDPEVLSGGDWDLLKRLIRQLGPAAMRQVRVPTGLHFRALYRDAENWGPPPSGHLRALARSSPHWPVQLRVPLHADEPPQAQVERALRDGLSLRLRYGVDLLQDMLAWSASHDPLYQS